MRRLSLRRPSFRRPTLRKATAGLTTVATVATIALVVLHPGVVTQEVDLNDGGVWVTNGDMRLVAHLNYPSQVLDGGLRAGSATFDVDQTGSEVFVSDPGTDSYTQVDVARTVLLAPTTAAGSSAMELGGDRVGVADPAAGDVWVMDAADYTSFDPTATAPVMEGMAGGVLAMGTDGSAHVASAGAGQMRTLTRAGTMDDVSTTDLPDLPDDAELQVTAVGARTVVLDRTSGTLVLPDGSTTVLKGDDLQLQVPGPDADEVLVASSAALLRVSLSGDVTTVAPTLAGGAPSRPAQHTSCAYAAWGGQGSFLRDCAGEADDVDMAVPSLDDATKAVFRVNRDVIVLNDIESGGLWLPDENMVQVDNWDEINSDVEKEEETEDDSTKNEDQTQPERDEDNTPPEAVDDEFGVRPGRSSYLPVILNDSDTDGDVLTASPQSQPSFGTVGQVAQGAALQVQVDEDASGSSAFEYVLDDGLATDTANVTLTVHPFSQNEGPKQLRTSSMVLGSGASGSLNVAGDWLDPDGDPIYLKSVSFPADLDVTYRADGTVNVKDLGSASGTVELTVTYSDGTEDTDGVLDVDVRGTDNIAPVANGDHVVTPVNQTVQVSPLLNDTDANGDTLRLISIGEAPEAVAAEADTNLAVVTITPSKTGTTYLTYQVTDGPASSTGVIRIDAIEPDQAALPVAQDDVATLPAGGQALVAVLENDSDPQGGVLTVQSVHAPDGSPLVVALLEHHLLRITAPGGLEQISEVTYTVANTAGTTEGHVMVIPVAAASATDPPELGNDSLVVRAGDVGSVSVLSNDRSPAGLTMTVQSDLQHEISPSMGEPFVSGNVVRFRAGQEAGSGKVIYTVRDSAGNVASATVNVTVVAMDEDRNTAPHPKDVTGWAVAGETVTIQIPLEGIDSEGDSVTLTGLGSSPRLGSVELGATSLAYTAAPDASGTDIFSYTVRDRLGKSATAVIRVGVAPAATNNQRPVALADLVTVKPGVKVSVPVLANDVDPDGDILSLVDDMVSSQDPAVSPEPKGSRVSFATPSAEGTYTMEYGVTDGRSDPVTGLLTVVVSATAPAQAPIARDDSVTLAQARSQGSVTVSVLDNDEDPDGDITSDTVESSDDGVSVGSDGSLTIDVRDQQRYVLYTVTDPDGLSASAVVDVPGSVITDPEVDTTNTPLTVRAGQTLTIPINDYVLARDGHTVQLTDGNKVTAAVGWDGTALVKDSTTLTFGAEATYSGPSSVTFEVTDGKDLNDSDGRVSTLTLPITVTPGDNRPPTITPTSVEVAAGEDGVMTDMSRWTTDPDGEDTSTFTYEVSDVPAAVSASVSGSSLNVKAPGDASQGAAGSLTVTVTDGHGAKATGSVPVTIVSSTRQRIQLSPASVTADAGKPVSVDVASYASNPFPDTPIHVVGTPVVSDGSRVSVSGTTLSITPPSGSHGTAVVTYRVGDKTNDAAREVEGTIQVTVRDRPDAPTAVRATSNSASTALVSWSAGAANGAPVTGFTLYDDTQGDSKDCGVVTSCLFDGRKNGVDHTFHVVAHNEVGDSDASPGAVTNIDVVPGTVPQAVGTAGDQQLRVSWAAPSNEGSAIRSYEVVLSPGGQSQTVSATSATFTGLSNGTAYTAVVRAQNDKGTGQEWSTPSTPVTPYGAPGAVGSVSAQAANLGTGGSSDTVTVSWGPVSDTNGRAIEYYTVTSSNGVSKVVNGGGAGSTTLEGVGTSTSQVTFTVTATNDSAAPGGHTSAGMSTTTWVVGKPPAPQASGLKATGSDNQVSMSTSAVAGNGWGTGDLSLEWSVNGASWQSTSNLSGNGLSNGSGATVYVRACGSKTGATACSDSTSAGTVTPYGPPVAPNVTCSGADGAVNCSWSGGSGNGRDATFTLSDAASGAANSSGSTSIGASEGQTKRLCVKVTQSESGRTAENCAQAGAKTYTRNKATFMGTETFTGGIGACATQACTTLGLELSNWPPNSAVTCTGDLNNMTVKITVNVDGNGYYKNGAPVFNWNKVDQKLGAVNTYNNWGGMLDPWSCSN